MQRRRFLIGTGSAAMGGSVLLGSGAFSRVESHRDMTIAVAEDPDAYLGLDKCPTPNGSYVDIDENGHLEVLMNPDNPTIGDTDLGEGVNSNSITTFDRVFQICNQGKENACVWIADNDDWPVVPEGENEAGERRVEFYLEDDPDQSVIGEENAIALELGKCVCIGIRVRTFGLEDGDELLGDLDNNIEIIADVDGDCFDEPPVFEECPFYGTTREDPTAINQISSENGTIVERQVAQISDDDEDSNYPNGLAYDDADDTWYYADVGGVLKTFNEDDDGEEEEYGIITPDGENIAGAAWWDQEDQYLFIPQNGDTLWAAEIDGDEVETEVVTQLDWSGIGLGDLAIDRVTQMLYVSTTRIDQAEDALFFSVDLTDTEEQDEIVLAPADSTEFATGKQIAFEQEAIEQDTLWAHEAEGGQWWTVDPATGAMSDDPVATTREYTDLARCGQTDVELELLD